jgi:hypothetical protein
MVGHSPHPNLQERSREMSKRILIVVVAVVAVVATGMATDAAYGGNIPIHWRVSGTIANVIFYPSTNPAAPQPGLLIQAAVKGSPGNGQFTITSVANQPGYVPECNGPGQTFAHNDMVITLDSLSMIFAKLQAGWVCFNPDYTVSAEAHMIITGGTGKYEGSSGYFTGNFEGQSVGTSGFLAAETGTIVGEIHR